MSPTRLLCIATAISLLTGCAPGKLSRADEEDISCLLASLSGFSTAKKADPNVQAPLTRALVQQAVYRAGRLQGRHGDDEWPKLIDQLEPSVMKVQIGTKLQACNQTSNLRSLMTNPKLKVALQRLGEREMRQGIR